MILLISDCPTPQHTPVYNRLHEEFGDRFQVVYLLPRPPDSRGWGEVAVRHHHAVWGTGSGGSGSSACSAPRTSARSS